MLDWWRINSWSWYETDIETFYLQACYISSQEDADQLMLNCSSYLGQKVVLTNLTINITLDGLIHVGGLPDIIDSTLLSFILAPLLVDIVGDLTMSNL